MSLYQSALTLHILGAVAMGPAFVMPIFTSRLRTPGADAPALLGTMSRVGMFPRVGLALLVLTGVTMSILNPSLRTHAWLDIAMALQPPLLVTMIFMARVGKRMGRLLPQPANAEAQTQVASLARRLHQLQGVMVSLMAVILLLMVTKPF